MYILNGYKNGFGQFLQAKKPLGKNRNFRNHDKELPSDCIQKPKEGLPFFFHKHYGIDDRVGEFYSNSPFCI